jgi:hypothetical protein
MARPWRDVLSVAEFEGMLADKNYVSASGAQAKLLGSSPAKVLGAINDKLRLYHAVPKRDLNSLPRRREFLHELSGLAQSYLTKFKVDLAVAAQRATRTVTPSGVERRRQTTGKDESLDRNLLTLQRRALRKKEYLVALENYCRANDAAEFIRYVREEVAQDRTGNLLGISDHNRVELEDFAHRDGFHHGALHTGFQDWLADNAGGNGIHFFLWLEGHEICISQNQTSAAYIEVTPVEYVQNGTGASASSKFQHLHVLGLHICKMDGTRMDTYADSYQAENQKRIRPSNRGGLAVGIAAFVWTEQRELFIAEHQSGKFHHSSLQAGARVGCAGMIGIRAGKIEEVSNNSGHYKPGQEHMRRFVRYYQYLLTNPHYISAGGFFGNINDFLISNRIAW